jgi:rubrerythrin
MATLVGTQHHFADALKALIELDYDAVEAYEAAIKRIENTEYKQKLDGFREDHLRHIRDISKLLEQQNESAPTGPDHTKQYLAKGKVIMAGLIGDKTILSALSSNETDTNTAYDKMLERTDLWEGAKEIIKKGAEDEHRHKAWLESVLG